MEGQRAAARVCLGGNEDTTRKGPRGNAGLMDQWEARERGGGTPSGVGYGGSRTGTWHSLSLEGDAPPP